MSNFTNEGIKNGIDNSKYCSIIDTVVNNPVIVIDITNFRCLFIITIPFEKEK